MQPVEYSVPSSATGFNTEEELARLVRHLQSTREAYQQTRQSELKSQAEARKIEEFKRKQREGKFTLDARKREPWRVGDQHLNAELERGVKPLPSGDIHPTKLYRTKHFLPRTFDEPEKPFVSTAKTGQEFGKCDPSKQLSKDSLSALKARESAFQEEVEKRRKQEMKRKQIVFANRWEPAHVHGRNFSTPQSDKYYLFEKDLKDRPFQSKPFLRTKRTGDIFSH